VAALMAMNNVYYRFAHGREESYASLPARLRMNRLASQDGQGDFELASLAVSALNAARCASRATSGPCSRRPSEAQVHEPRASRPRSRAPRRAGLANFALAAS